MLWWIGNLILLVAVVPIAVALLSRVLGALERIRKASDDILAGGVALVGELDTTPDLLATTDRTIEEGKLRLDCRVYGCVEGSLIICADID